MKVDFRQADLSALTEIYNRSFPERYAVDVELFRQHTVEHPTFDWGASCIEPGKAFVAVKKSPALIYPGPNKDAWHVCSLGFYEPMLLLELFKELKICLVNRGASTLHFGTDSGHFFPGCPTDFPWLGEFLLIGGFQEGGLAHDLERDLGTYSSPVPAPPDVQIRPINPQDLKALEDFLRLEFPGRWHYDTFSKIAAEGRADFVVGMFSGKKCCGFALTQSEGCKTQIGGAVWKKHLGPGWCSLGPIGVGRDMRGKGRGSALLGGALEYLRDLGGKRCIIDWTGLVDFYGGHGFEVSRTYHYLSLDLEPHRQA